MKKGTSAFTIVELIIVIAVIGILAAILIPAFTNIIAKANAKSALSDARNTLTLYLGEAAQNENLPANIVIFVQKAKQYYIYGYTAQQGALTQSDGNPFRYMNLNELIVAYNYKGVGVPDSSATYNLENDGAFYLVPIAERDTSPIKGVSTMKANESVNYINLNKEIGNVPIGTDVFYGVLLPGVWISNSDTPGGSNGTGTSDVWPDGGGTGGGMGEPGSTPDVTPDSSQYAVVYSDGIAGEVVVVPAGALVNVGEAYAIDAAVPVRDGYRFVNWICDYDSKNYSPTEALTFSNTLTGGTTVTLTAQWGEQHGYNVIFKTGVYQNSTNIPGARAAVEAGAVVTIPISVPRMAKTVDMATDGYAFTHWVDQDSHVYYPGDSIVVTKDVTLTAQWDSGYTVLATTESFYTMDDSALNMTKKYVLGADIALYTSASSQGPLGFDMDALSTTDFTGTLNGAGYLVYNLNFQWVSTGLPIGLFVSNNGTVCNFTLQVRQMLNTTIQGNVAAVNKAEGVIRNIIVTKYTASGSGVCTSNNTSSTISVQQAVCVGGVAGKNYGLISGCSVDSLTMTVKRYNIGGIAGQNMGRIEKCCTTALAFKCSGGYWGYGGIAGRNGYDGTSNYKNAVIDQCFVNGLTVSGSTYNAGIGGIVGVHENGTISNCYVEWRNNTQTTVYSGIFAGECNAAIVNCWGIGNAGYANAAVEHGALGGWGSSASMSNCYLINGIEPTNAITNVNVVTEAELKAKISIANWGGDTWSFGTTSDLPTLLNRRPV